MESKFETYQTLVDSQMPFGSHVFYSLFIHLNETVYSRNESLFDWIFLYKPATTHSLQYSRKIWILFQSWYTISMKTIRFRRIRGDVSKQRLHNHVFNLCEDYSYFLPDFYSLCMQYVQNIGVCMVPRRILRHSAWSQVLQ